MKALSVSFGACIALFAATSAQSSIVTIGNSLARTCFEAAEARERNPVALTNCDLALSQEALDNQDRVATLVNRGILHMLDQKYTSAGRDFDAALALNPSEPEAWLNKAILSVQQKHSVAAFPLVDRALALNTRKPALAYYVRGIANEDAGNLKAAYADLIRARDLAPGWADPGEQLRRYKVR